MKRINLNTLIAIALLLVLFGGGFMSQQPQQIVRQAAQVATADLVEAGWKHLPFTTTAANPVTGWYHVYLGQMYDKTNNALAAAPTWTDCVTAITVDNTTGIFEDTPESTMPSGWYVWRLYDSAAPAYTDEHIKSKLVYWSKEREQITWIGGL